jgi:glycosyltransferase involved in cell wall biosynthesis
MKVAIVHDWLNGMRGGEKCLEVFCELFPRAHLYSLFHDKGRMSPGIEAMDIRTSFIQKLPGVLRRYRYYLPLFPRAIERFDLRGYDLIISSSHCVAKGAIPGPKTRHLCYCYTPMRYVWDMYEQYFGRGGGGLAGRLMPLFRKRLQAWDVRASERVHRFVGISEHVRDRIRRHYGRESDLICPPVDCGKFRPSENVGDYYLIVSAFAPYKRLDIAIEAFNRSGRPLKVIGDGQDAKSLMKTARGNIEFPGWQDDRALADYYARCRAFIFPGEEDFGITPLEAQAAGRPVIAYAKGGVLETVVPLNPQENAKTLSGAPTGVFLYEQTAEALNEAVEMYEKNAVRFDPAAAVKNAARFDRAVFKDAFAACVDSMMSGARTAPREDQCSRSTPNC